MKMDELLSAYMEMEFGSSAKACARLKALVNEALDQSDWHDDFDIAGKKGELDHYECARLWDAVKKSYPVALERMTEQVSGVNRYFERELCQARKQPSPWHQLAGAPIEWLVADDGSLIVTEGHRVFRFVDGSLIWVTKEISPYGIHLTAITKEEVLGMGYYPTAKADDWWPFRLTFPDGAFLEGEEIP